jgi:hypothetical protein
MPSSSFSYQQQEQEGVGNKKIERNTYLHITLLEESTELRSRLPVIKTCGCGRTFSKQCWDQLILLGHIDVHEDNDQRGELRQCSCGSSIALDLQAP